METSIIELETGLQDIGLTTGDTVMVHASLRSVGPVVSGAEGLLQIILSILGHQGTLLVYADFEPTAAIPYFDPQRSPASYDHGVFAEVARRHSQAMRSLNPGASMVAIGARAEWLCRDHPLHYGYGPGSPLAKLVEAEGKVLLLGSDFNNITLLHYAEHCARLPNKRIIQRTDKALFDGIVKDIDIEEFDTSELVLSNMPDDYFAQITREFIQTQKANHGFIGRAYSILFSAEEFVDFAIDKIEKEFGVFSKK